jgi:hypothetical protein
LVIRSYTSTTQLPIMHIDSWLFLMLVAIAMLFRWLMSAANKASKDSREDEPRSTSTPPPVPHAPADSEEERIRKFLEALGQPPGSRPPPPVAPRPTYQKPVVLPHVPPPIASPLPPLTTRPPDLPQPVTLPRQITKPPYERKLFRPKVLETSFEVHEATTAPAPPPPAIQSPPEAYAIATEPKREATRSEMNIAALLRSPSGLRSAIILREVFGPPRSVQSLDEMRT